MELICVASESAQLILDLQEAVKMEIPYSDHNQRNFPDHLIQELIPAAVLVLFACSRAQGVHLLFTRRSETVETHKGQMAFPGGHCDRADLDGPSGTALRETEEEVGILREYIEVLGGLPPLVTPTGFFIQPIVGFLKIPLEEVVFHLSADEIAETLWVPIEKLNQSEVYRREFVSVLGKELPIDVFQVDHYRIWGATGTMTKNILDRLSFTR